MKMPFTFDASENNTTVTNGCHHHTTNSSSSNQSSLTSMVKTKCDQERQVLGQLNDRFVRYLGRVRVLEAQNKQITAELEQAKKQWCGESGLVKDECEPRLSRARAEINASTRDKAQAELNAKRSEHDANEWKMQHEIASQESQALRNKIGCLEQLLADNNNEQGILQRQVDEAVDCVEKLKQEMKRSEEEAKRLADELDKETLRRVEVQNEKQTLEEQIPFLKAVHEREKAEIKLMSTVTNAQVDTAQFYRTELERAVQCIRADFAELSDQNRRDLEEWYRVKVDEMMARLNLRNDATLDASGLATPNSSGPYNKAPTESPNSLRSTLNQSQLEFSEEIKRNKMLLHRLAKLEDELEQTRINNAERLRDCERNMTSLSNKYNDLVGDYEDLMHSKASIEFEISAYKRLLDSEETRNGGSQTPIVQNEIQRRAGHVNVRKNGYGPVTPILSNSAPKLSTFKGGQASSQQNGHQNGDFSPTTTLQRNHKGPLSIAEVHKDGLFILIENTSSTKDVLLTNWRLRRELYDINNNTNPQQTIEFKFPDGLVLRRNTVLKVWAGRHGRHEPAHNEIQNKEHETWGVSQFQAITHILNKDNQEKGTHIQKTLYTQN